MNKITVTSILIFTLISNIINAQSLRYIQTNTTPKVLKMWSNDTLLNPFAGGINAPQFSNIDWNNDGKADLFVFDRESKRPIAFTFLNGKMVHTPQYEAAFRDYLTGWVFLRDHNYDGKPDLFTYAFSHNKVTADPIVLPQAVQLFVNTRTPGGKFYFKQYSNTLMDTGLFVGPPFNQNFPPSNVYSVENALPAFGDLDGDGDDDMITNQGFSSTNIYYENYKKNKQNTPFSNDTTAYVFRDRCWGFASYKFENHTYELGFDRARSNECVYNMWGKKAKHADQSLCMIDLNGDGIKDLIMGDSEYNSFISLINGRLQNSRNIDSIIRQDTLFLSKNGTRRNFIEFPACYYVDINADNKNELLVTTNKTLASKSVDNIWLFDATRVNSNLQFNELPGNDFLYADMVDLGLRSVPVFTDADGDGDKDLVVSTSGILEKSGNNNDRMFLFLNIGDSTRPVFKMVDSNFAELGSRGPGFFAAHPTFGDLNGDGKDDLLIGDGNGSLSYFEHEGNTGLAKYKLMSRNAFNILIGTFATPQIIDLDKDGLNDIVCGQRNGTVKFYKNNGTKTSPQFNSTATIDSLGKVNSREVFSAIGVSSMVEINGFSTPHVLDADLDGVWEMYLGSSTGRIFCYTNVYANKDSVAKPMPEMFVDFGRDSNAAYHKRFGSRSVITSANLNQDSLPDLIIGNISGGLMYLAAVMELPKDSVRPGFNEAFLKQQFQLYPNPATQQVVIQLDLPLQSKWTIKMYDVTGKLIKQEDVSQIESSKKISLQGIQEGLYFIEVNVDGIRAAKRLLVQQP